MEKYKNEYDIRWLPYDKRVEEWTGKETMPFIPSLISSKYKEIVKLIIKKDKDHTNGIIFHKQYQVHHHLDRTLQAFGARWVDPPSNKVTKNDRNDYYDDFIANAKQKILNKWAQYHTSQKLTQEQIDQKVEDGDIQHILHLHDNKQEGRDDGAKNILWDAILRNSTLKNWGL